MTSLYLVDDHVIMREGLRSLLESRGYNVLGDGADPTEALADLMRLRPDVLLLDLNLGDRSGLELQAELQRRQLRIRTVVLTMSAQPHQVAEALRLGASGYVLKGSPATDLTAAIDTAMQGKKYLGIDVEELALKALVQINEVSPFHRLSPRERQIILMVVDGKSSAAIGTTLHLSPKTVATYRSRLMKKLQVQDVPNLVRLAVRHKLVDAEVATDRNRRIHDK